MQPMNVLVIDGQGGGLGKQLVAALSTQCPEARLTAGENSRERKREYLYDDGACKLLHVVILSC